MDLMALVVVDLESLQPPGEGLPTGVGVEGFLVGLALERLARPGTSPWFWVPKVPLLFFHFR